MPNNIETFVLAETDRIESRDGPPVEIIKGMVRTYESRERAEADLELLSDLNTGRRFNVFPVPHIDR